MLVLYAFSLVLCFAYEHLKGVVGLGGRKARSEQVIMDEDGTLLRDKVRIRERWRGFFQTLLNKKSPKFDPTPLSHNGR